MLKLIERISGVIMKIEKLIINKLKELNYNLSCCESCTGGMIISTLIGVPGASNVINESYVTYSNEAKCRILGVDNKTIEKYNLINEDDKILVGVSGGPDSMALAGFLLELRRIKIQKSLT